ncbi:putative gustatory receptor 39b [Zeugodacus cucurbitae]|uniref:putative gustatory receptor 39b n=1 Tax=Zeugodacus cucurbitae TaxID=28588 RepID=UPI0023D955E1|nr:putative gustatory receptor 39b [Zeugodacus cucurbitae]
MELQLRRWLRYSLIFGLYMSPTQETQYINRRTTPKKRLAWLGRRQILQPQHLKIIYLHLLLIGICVVFVKAIASRKPIPGIASEVVTTMILSLQAVSSLIIAAEGLWCPQQHETFLRLLQEIEFSLKLRLRENVKIHSLPSRVLWLLKYMLWLSLICFGMAIYNFRQLQHVGYFWYSLGYNVIMRLRIIQLCVYVCVLGHYMECLCLKLQQLVAYRTAPNQQLLDIDYEKLKTPEYLRDIKHVYDLLYKAFEQLNAFAGWSLFTIITCYILDYGSALYWVLLSWEGYLESCSYYVPGFWWLLPMTAIIWHICYMCHNCKQLDRLLATNLRRIIIMSSSQSKCSFRIFLQQFSTQLELQCIEVTAKSFFIIDLRLLMSVLVSVTSYMVMLIQFLYN